MNLKSQQQLWVTPLPEMPVFEKTLAPKAFSVSWEREIASCASITRAGLSPRLQQIQARSQEIQAQLQQLTQGYPL